MNRGYWIPPGHKNLKRYDGFYIDSSAVYKDGYEIGWDIFLKKLLKSLCFYDNSFHKYCEWRMYCKDRSRFVIAYNKHVEIVAEDIEDYVAVFAIIPEDCKCPGFAKRSFNKYINTLGQVLCYLYPGHINKRLNSQNIYSIG